MPGKITDLNGQTGAQIALTDLTEMLDVSDTSMAPTGTNKKVPQSEYIAFLNANGVGATQGVIAADGNWNTYKTAGTWQTQPAPTSQGAPSAAEYSMGTLMVFRGGDVTDTDPDIQRIVQMWIPQSGEIFVRAWLYGEYGEFEQWGNWRQRSLPQGFDDGWLGWGNGQPQWGALYLDTLNDVTITDAADGQVIGYDQNAGGWVNVAGGGGDPVVLPSGTDYNTVLTPGVYSLPSPVNGVAENAPSVWSGGVLEVVHYAENDFRGFTLQTFTDSDGGNHAKRVIEDDIGSGLYFKSWTYHAIPAAPVNWQGLPYGQTYQLGWVNNYLSWSVPRMPPSFVVTQSIGVASYTLSKDHQGALILLTRATAQTITIPKYNNANVGGAAWGPYSVIWLAAVGAGTVTITPDSANGVTLNGGSVGVPMSGSGIHVLTRLGSGTENAWQLVTPSSASDALKADKTTTITTMSPLTGGGDLSTNRSLNINNFTSAVKGAVPPPGSVTNKAFLRDDGTWEILENVKLAPVRRPIQINGATALSTFYLTDENTMFRLTSVSAVTITLPSDATLAFPIGAEMDFLWHSTGQPSFVAGSGATVNGTPGLKLRAQFSAATAKKVAANTWVVIGDLSL